MNEDGMPFRMVRDNILDIRNVVNNPKMMVAVSTNDESIKLKFVSDKSIKNIDIIAINSGKAQFTNRNF